MANKIVKNIACLSRGKEVLGKNSAVFSVGDFVSVAGGIATPSTTSGVIDGVANGTITFASDNQTVAKKKLGITICDAGITEVEVEISGGTITVDDEGKYFKLTDANTVDGTSEATSPVGLQLKLVKFISATKGVFTTIATEIDTIA